MMMGFGGFGMIFMFIFWVAVVVLAIWLLGALFPQMGNNHYGRASSGSMGSSGTALEILKERYARGEITKEEYDEIKRDLVSQ